MKIIGLNGRAGSGKDTAFEYLQEKHPDFRMRRVGFADKLKLSAALALGFDPQNVEEAVAICNTMKDKGSITTVIGDRYSNFGSVIKPISEFRHISGREFQQRYGTEAHREIFGEDFWVDALLPSLSSNTIAELIERFPETDVLFVTDARFPNEARRILDLGGSMWEIDAHYRLGRIPADAHVSELGLPPQLITHTIENNSTLHQFYANLNAVFYDSF